MIKFAKLLTVVLGEAKLSTLCCIAIKILTKIYFQRRILLVCYLFYLSLGITSINNFLGDFFSLKALLSRANIIFSIEC